MTRFFAPRFLLAALLFSTLFSAAALFAGRAGLDESRKELEEIQHRIRQTSKNLEKKNASARALSKDLKTVERELGRVKARIARLSKEVSGLDHEIGTKEKEIEQTRDAVKTLERKVRIRLAALYKGGEAGFLRVMFSTSSPSRLAEDYDFLGRIVRRDRELLLGYRQQVEKLQGSLQQLSALRQKQQSALADLGEDRQTLRQAVHLKEELLARVRRDRTVLSAQLEDLKEKAGRLEALVKKLESQKPREYTRETGIFTSQKGHLPWPVPGRIKVGFGTLRHPELGTLYDSQGIEIGVTDIKPIMAVWEGQVIFADRFKGYGNLIIVDHGDNYYTLYAQASRLTKKVGDKVRQGEVLAFSGFEGADGVYFEIRHRGNPLDPTAWLAPQ